MFLTMKMIKLHSNESTFQPRPSPPGPDIKGKQKVDGINKFATSGQNRFSPSGQQRVEVAMAGLSLGMVIEGGRDTMQKVSGGDMMTWVCTMHTAQWVKLAIQRMKKMQ